MKQTNNSGTPNNEAVCYVKQIIRWCPSHQASIKDWDINFRELYQGEPLKSPYDKKMVHNIMTLTYSRASIYYRIAFIQGSYQSTVKEVINILVCCFVHNNFRKKRRRNKMQFKQYKKGHWRRPLEVSNNFFWKFFFFLCVYSIHKIFCVSFFIIVMSQSEREYLWP